MLHAAALAELDLQVRKAQRVLMRDRWGAALVACAIAALVWFAVGLFDLPRLLPPLAETLIGYAALGGIGFLGWRGLRRFRKPTRDEARAALAQSCALDPGAFDILEDRPARMDAASLALWGAARAQAVQEAITARPRLRMAALNTADPWRLRFVAAGLFALGLLAAGGAAPERLGRTLVPSPGPLLGDGRLTVEAWAAPAAYTNAPPVPLSGLESTTVATPPAITITLRAQGLAGAPVLVFDPDRGPTQRLRLSQAADGAYEGDLAIPGPGVLRLVRFHTVARWRLEPAPDAAPEAKFTLPPAPGRNEDLLIAWRASDDFGVRAVGLSVRPVDPPEGLRDVAPHVTIIDGPAGDPLSAEGETAVDLAEHPYAGMRVEMRLLALDARGQEGLSDPIEAMMPEKIFLQPLALAAIEIRRAILWERRPYREQRAAQGGPVTLPASGDGLLGIEPLIIETDDQFPTIERAPQAIRRAVRRLDALTFAPRDGYFTDIAVFAGFRYARDTLVNAAEIEETDAAAQILWAIALRAEYGSSADAARALEQAQRALGEALARGDPPERIQRLMDALQEATRDYLQALVAEAQNQPQENRDDTEEQTEISGADIEDMLEEVERLAEDGQTAEAEQLLQELSQLLQNLEVRLADGPGANPNGEGAEGGANDAIRGLNKAMRDLEALAEDTQAAQQGGPGEGDQGAPGEEAGEAEGEPGLADRLVGLRRDLEEARNAAGERGDNADLEAADEALGEALDALREGDLEEAAAAQQRALERLRAGTEQAAASSPQDESQPQQGEAAAPGATDPLGRQTQDAGASASEDGGDALPADVERTRARDILDELRRRAQDQTRSQEERDYLQRLLDRFEGS
jgi:hypothetical protein